MKPRRIYRRGFISSPARLRFSPEPDGDGTLIEDQIQTAVPQFAQNLAPGCRGDWQFLQGCGTSDSPQLEQNFVPSGTFVLQEGHSTIAA
jgi:hypothetical protein